MTRSASFFVSSSDSEQIQYQQWQGIIKCAWGTHLILQNALYSMYPRWHCPIDFYQLPYVGVHSGCRSTLFFDCISAPGVTVCHLRYYPSTLTQKTFIPCSSSSKGRACSLSIAHRRLPVHRRLGHAIYQAIPDMHIGLMGRWGWDRWLRVLNLFSTRLTLWSIGWVILTQIFKRW